MPALRGGRAPKACELCRRQKTRCYASDSPRGTCLRCDTLCQPCSLENTNSYGSSTSPTHSHPRRSSRNMLGNVDSSSASVTERLDQLEKTVQALVDRLDEKDTTTKSPSAPRLSPTGKNAQSSAESQEPAPVFLIRDAAADAGVHSPAQVQAQSKLHPDVISTGLVTLENAYSLLSLFHVHYGRWVKFAEGISTELLLLQVRRSPLLLCSVFLISVRHTTQELAIDLAPRLFEEAKGLFAASLLAVPQSMEFFQAALVLSLWSTTIGQMPLSVDSWLLTGYALQQCLVSPYFKEVLGAHPHAPATGIHLDAWCIWNHLCIAHLQYCVGTRRPVLLDQSQIDRCLGFLESDHVTNFEARMVAEVKLYHIIYEKCCGSEVDLTSTKSALQEWQREWISLFNRPRAQFLQMGFHFAHLLAYYLSLKSTNAVVRGPVLTEMIQLSKSIIDLAMDTTDERTRHLTDHIYHIITFSALTLCRLIHTYEPKLRAAHHDLGALDDLVLRLIGWLKTVGLPCHAAYLLGDVVSTQFQKLRPNYQPADTNPATGIEPFITYQDPLPSDIGFLYPDYIGSELFDMSDTSWPQWDMMLSDTDTRPLNTP